MMDDMNVLPEQEVESILRGETRRHGGRAYKFVCPGCRGVPDRLICLPGGKILFCELKRHGKRPRPDQSVQIRRLRELGAEVHVAAGLMGLADLFASLGWADSLDRVLARMRKGEK